MPIVINEFEVVPPPAPGVDGAKEKPADQDDKPKTDKAQILALLRKQTERAARVRAH